MKQVRKRGIEITEVDGVPLASGNFHYWDTEFSNIIMHDMRDYCPDVIVSLSSHSHANAFQALYHYNVSGVDKCGTSQSLEDNNVFIPECDIDAFIDCLDKLHQRAEQKGISEDIRNFLKSFRVPSPCHMKCAWRVTSGLNKHLLVLWGYAASRPESTVLPLTPTSETWDDADKRVDLRKKLQPWLTKHQYNWHKIVLGLSGVISLLLLILGISCLANESKNIQTLKKVTENVKAIKEDALEIQEEWNVSIKKAEEIAGQANNVIEEANNKIKKAEQLNKEAKRIKEKGESEWLAVPIVGANTIKVHDDIEKVKKDVNQMNKDIKEIQKKIELMKIGVSKTKNEKTENARGKIDKVKNDTMLAKKAFDNAKKDAQKIPYRWMGKTEKEINKADVEIKMAEDEVMKAEKEINKADAEVKRAEVEVNKADAEVKRAEVEVNKADAEVKRDEEGDSTIIPDENISDDTNISVSVVSDVPFGDPDVYISSGQDTNNTICSDGSAEQDTGKLDIVASFDIPDIIAVPEGTVVFDDNEFEENIYDNIYDIYGNVKNIDIPLFDEFDIDGFVKNVIPEDIRLPLNNVSDIITAIENTEILPYKISDDVETDESQINESRTITILKVG